METNSINLMTQNFAIQALHNNAIDKQNKSTAENFKLQKQCGYSPKKYQQASVSFGKFLDWFKKTACIDASNISKKKEYTTAEDFCRDSLPVGSILAAKTILDKTSVPNDIVAKLAAKSGVVEEALKENEQFADAIEAQGNSCITEEQFEKLKSKAKHSSVVKANPELRKMIDKIQFVSNVPIIGLGVVSKDVEFKKALDKLESFENNGKQFKCFGFNSAYNNDVPGVYLADANNKICGYKIPAKDGGFVIIKNTGSEPENSIYPKGNDSLKLPAIDISEEKILDTNLCKCHEIQHFKMNEKGTSTKAAGGVFVARGIFPNKREYDATKQNSITIEQYSSNNSTEPYYSRTINVKNAEGLVEA